MQPVVSWTLRVGLLVDCDVMLVVEMGVVGKSEAVEGEEVGIEAVFGVAKAAG